MSGPVSIPTAWLLGPAYADPLGVDGPSDGTPRSVATGADNEPQQGGTVPREWIPAALLATVLICAGCSGPGAAASDATARAAATTAPTSTAVAAGSTGAVNSAGTARTTSPEVPLPGASADATTALHGISCVADATGSWSFHGTVHNTSASAKHYTVALALTRGASVVGHGVTSVTVPAGAQRTVSSAGFATVRGSAACETVVSAEEAA